MCRKIHCAIKFVITSCSTFPHSIAATKKRQQFWFMVERWIYWLPRYGTQDYETLWCDKEICISYLRSNIISKIFISWDPTRFLSTYVKGKAAPLQAWRGPEGSRKLRFPWFVTTAQDGGKVVSLTPLPPLSPGNTLGNQFCYGVSRSQGHSATGRIMSLKNSNYSIGNRIRDLQVYSVLP